MDASSHLYTCPMHPEIVKDHPGDCPICGMALEPILKADSIDSEDNSLLLHFLVSLLFTLPVLLISSSDLFSSYLSSSNDLWIQLLLSSLVVVWGGWPLLEKGWKSLINRSPNMFTLISLGILSAYIYSLFATLFPQWVPISFHKEGVVFVYYEAACVITVLVLLGQLFEIKARGKTNLALQRLMNKAATLAHEVVENQESDILIDQVKVNAILRVKPGEKIPVDGIIIEGVGLVDESMISGEVIPLEKKANDFVTGGTINQSGSFLMRAKRVGSKTILARIIALVADAQRTRAPIQKTADQVAAYFVPLVIFIALLTFIAWIFLGPEPRFAYALINAISVLIIACPCALGLATPLSVMVGIGQGAEMGILIKNAESLETLGNVTTVVVDKTGTLTEGKPKVVDIVCSPQWNKQILLLLVGTLERQSEHPIAQAIVKAAQADGLNLTKENEFRSYSGGGVSGLVEGHHIVMGNAEFVQIKGISSFDQFSVWIEQHLVLGHTLVYIGINGQATGIIAIADTIKSTTPKAIRELHQMGIKVIMLTGDHEKVAKSLAQELDIDRYQAQVSPQNKYQFIKELRQSGICVAMAGDGINDAPALAEANVGIAMGTGTDVAMESSEITLVKGDLMGIVRAIALSRATMRNIWQNLFFAFIYNFAGIPLAAGVLYPFLGILLSPMVASAAMSLSSLSVILNALRLSSSRTLRNK